MWCFLLVIYKYAPKSVNIQIGFISYNGQIFNNKKIVKGSGNKESAENVDNSKTQPGNRHRRWE